MSDVNKIIPSREQRRVLMAVAGLLREKVVFGPADQELVQSVIDAGWLELHEIESWGSMACLGEWRITEYGKEVLGRSLQEPPE